MESKKSVVSSFDVDHLTLKEPYIRGTCVSAPRWHMRLWVRARCTP